MKPTQLNNHQIEALNNGATMLWIPISREMKVYSRMKDYEENGLDATIELDDILKGEVEPYDETKDLIKYSSPLQIGQDYYAQTAKEFECSWCKGKDPYCTDCYGKGKVWDIDIEIEFKVTDIQVKRVQEISYRERCSMSIPKNGAYWEKDVENWHNKQYPNQPYEDNPYGFLVTVERLL